MKLTGIREQVFLDRYSLKDEKGHPLEKTPEEMWRRVARGVAQIEEPGLRKIWEKKFFEVMEDFKLVPGGRILSGAGTGYKVTFYNCFVVPSPRDSRDGILETLKQMVEIMARGGGVGINLSTLRPRGARVKKVNGFSSGPCNWAELFSVATKDIIQQGGCFSGDTRIMTHRGLVPIEEIMQSRGAYYTATHHGYKKITTKFDNGVKKLYEVKTEAGFSVRTTLEHKFLTFDRHGKFYLKPLSDFQEGNNLVHLLGEWSDELPDVILNKNLPTPSKYSYGLKEVSLPRVLNEDLAFILGAYHSDGSKIPDEFAQNGKGIRIAVADNRSHDLERLKETVLRCFNNITAKLRKGDGAITIVQIFSRRLNEFLKLNGFLKESSRNVSVPEQIFTSPKRVVEAYIAGVFLGDGSNCGGKGGLRICTVSERFAYDLQLLLVNLGIPAKIKTQLRKEKNWRTLYTVTVNGATFMKRFINFLARYTEKALDKKISIRDGFFGWPFNVVERFLYVPMFQRTQARTNPTTSQKSVLFLQQMTPILQEKDKIDVEFLVNCVPDTISSITYVGEENVYDLEVEDVHLLSGNGFYTSNSRRGALMLMLWDWHPDIEEFITVKRDLSRINGANLSVCVSDKFMEAVKKDGDWDLVFPDTNDKEYDTKWEGYLDEWQKGGRKVKVYKTVKARKIWDLICEAAWASAEPGVVFMERYNKWFNNWYFNKVNCVNPCVTGDTLVATEKGWMKAKELTPGVKILTPKGLKPIDKVYNNGKQRIYKITFSDGGNLCATADHKLRIVRNDRSCEWVKVVDLQDGDYVAKLFFLGSVNQSRKSQQDKTNENKENDNHQQVISIKSSYVHGYNFAFLAKTRLADQAKILISNQNIIPDSDSTLSIPVMIGGKAAKAKTTCPTSAIISESFLSSDRVNNGLSINNLPSFPTNPSIQYSFAKVIHVEDTGKYEEVFDVYEPETLTWVTNGYVSLDCGEEGLPPWGVCNLTSVNLSALVKNGKIDYKILAEIAKIAVRFQDDIIDADAYIFPEIREVQQNGERRIGLGTMGLGDALIKMKVRYGSDESLKIIDKIYSTTRNAAYEASVEIAREKGPFPKFNASKYLKGYFIKKLPKKIREGIKKWGIRNSVLLQQAPTGSTSLLSGVSSGIEPVYEFSFIRRDRLGEHRLYHPLFEQWKKAHPEDPTPSYFVSANDLTPEDHVRVQAAIQKYVDASISKTVNAPKTHTVQDVKKLYTLAYELGCKGVTYMRDGSRPGVLERITSEKKEVKEEAKPNGETRGEIKPRPMMVHGATYQIDTPVGAAFVTINTGEHNEPLEVFINVGKAGSDVTAMAEALGRLASLVLRLQSSVPAGERTKQIFNQLIGIGGSKSLGFGDKKVRSLPDAVAKVLAMHFGYKIKNGNGQQAVQLPSSLPVLTQQPLLNDSEFDLCPSCGEAALAYEEGCKKCYSCGYSEC